MNVKNTRFSFLLLVPVLLMACFAISSCEDSTVGGAIVDAVDQKDGDNKASENLSGTWKGISGSSQCHTSVSLTDQNGVLSGTLRWSWGGTRRLSGSRSGNSVSWVLDCDARDSWSMTLSPDRKTLTGSAKKNDGGGYRVSLTRQ